MATTDSNDLVLLEATDNLVPLQTTINGVTASISTALNNSVRTFKAASESARNTLATKRTPSATNPLVVWRTDKKWWDINDGSGWKSIHPDPNKIVVNGTAYQRSGTIAGSWKVGATPASSGTYYKYFRVTLPVPAAPSGWRYYVTQIESTAIVWTCHANSGSNWVDFHVFGVADNAQMTKLRWELVPA